MYDYGTSGVVLKFTKKTHNPNENTALKEVERTGTESTDTAM